jgi:renalase
MAPCWTVMAALDASAPRLFASSETTLGALSWIAQDSSKPGRSQSLTNWVAQASPAWSTQHLEETSEAVIRHLLPLLCTSMGAREGDVRYAAAHRWRYATVATALGMPFLRSDDATLYVGGDGLLGARIEDAWTSGNAIARDLLDRPGDSGCG